MPHAPARIAICSAALALASTGWACAEQPPAGPVDCARVSDVLLRIANAPDPAVQARQAGVPSIDGAVRVLVELQPDREVPADLPGTVEAQFLPYVQVLIEPARLCELAGHDAVLAARPPFRAAPGAPDRVPPGPSGP